MGPDGGLYTSPPRPLPIQWGGRYSPILSITAAWNLLRCSHPEPVFAVTFAIAVLALSAGRGWSTGWAVAAVFAGQLFVFALEPFAAPEVTTPEGQISYVQIDNITLSMWVTRESKPTIQFQ